MWPGVTIVPEMSTGATDGLYVRNAGIPVYGVSAVQDGSVDQADAELKNLVRRTLSDRRGREYYADYRASLRLQAKPTLYPDRL